MDNNYHPQHNRLLMSPTGGMVWMAERKREGNNVYEQADTHIGINKHAVGHNYSKAIRV